VCTSVSGLPINKLTIEWFIFLPIIGGSVVMGCSNLSLKQHLTAQKMGFTVSDSGKMSKLFSNTQIFQPTFPKKGNGLIRFKITFFHSLFFSLKSYEQPAVNTLIHLKLKNTSKSCHTVIDRQL
jgi:hypothetical protein